MTRRNIEYNLKKSPYVLQYGYYQFYFSSELYKCKFEELIEEKKKTLEERLKKIIGFNINTGILAYIKTYSEIEKRGFYIKVLDTEITEENSDLIRGVITIEKTETRNA